MIYVLLDRGDRDRGSDREIFTVANLPVGGSVTLGFMDFTHVQNTGAAFSMFSNGTWLLALLSAVMAAVVIFFCSNIRNRRTRSCSILPWRLLRAVQSAT